MPAMARSMAAAVSPPPCRTRNLSAWEGRLAGGDDASGGGGEAAVEVGGGEAAVEVKPLMKLTISVFAAPLCGG